MILVRPAVALTAGRPGELGMEPTRRFSNDPFAGENMMSKQYQLPPAWVQVAPPDGPAERLPKFLLNPAFNTRTGEEPSAMMRPLLNELRGRIETILRPDNDREYDDCVKEVALELARLYNNCEWEQLRKLVQEWNEPELPLCKGLVEYR
jgi:hypothetical protein